MGSMLHSDALGALELEGNERWFLVHTKPRCERRAELHPRRARVQDAFPDNSKDHSPCPSAQERAGAAFPTLHLPHPRSATRPLVVGAEHRWRFLAIYLR